MLNSRIVQVQKGGYMNSRYLIALLVISSVLVAVPGHAQVVGKNLKIFVGYANLQAEGLQNNNTPPAGAFDTDFFRDRTTLHGGNFSITGAYKGVGLTGDVSFNRNRQESDITGGRATDDLDITYFMGGPAFHYAGDRRVEPFARILAGGAYTRRDVSATVTSGSSTSTSSFETHSTSFAMGIGGGLDVRLGDGPVRVRIIQIDYTTIFFRDRSISVLGAAGAIQPFNLEGQRADNVRFAFGFVF